MRLWIVASVLSVGLGMFAGGWKDQDPTDPTFAAQLTGYAAVPDGFNLTAVQTQVVAGENIKYIYENPNGVTCEIIFFTQAWTNTNKVTLNTCQQYVSKRMLMAVGGFMDQDATDPKWTALLNTLSSDGLISLNSNDVEIKGVATQVVAGVNTKFTLIKDGKLCTFVYFEQVWTNTKTISSDTCGIKVTHKRQFGGGLGGWVDRNPAEQKWATMLAQLETDGLVSYHSVSNLEILSVQTQVVNGINYKFTFKYGNKQCTLVDYEPADGTAPSITSDSCHLATHKRGMPGGWQPGNPSDQQWMDMLIAMQNNHVVQFHGVNDLEIINVTYQVVNGENVNIFFRDNHKVCNLVFYAQSWTNTYDVKTDSCGIQATHKRQAGSWAVQDASEQKWADKLNELANNNKISSLTGDQLEIVDVETQVVAGLNYKYTLKINGKLCTLAFFEQVWTNTLQISTDTCHLAVHHRRQLAGGYSKQDATDAKWSTMLNELQDKYCLANFANTNMEIVGVSQQVVAGMNYKFTLKVNGKVCELIVFEQSWTNTHQISVDTCGVKTTMTSCPAKRASTDATHECLAAVLDRVNAMSNSMFRMVESHHNMQTSVQSTNGDTHVAIKVQLTESSCMNGGSSQGMTSVECPPVQGSPMHSVWEGKCHIFADNTPLEVTDLNMVSH